MARRIRSWHAGLVVAALVVVALGAARIGGHDASPARSRWASTLPASSSVTNPNGVGVGKVAEPATRGLPEGLAYYDVVPAGCVIRGSAAAVLPDPSCTPGATNPAVTKATMASTICQAGWTSTIRPPSSFTTRLKVRQMAAWGIAGSTRVTEEDHLVPLELGGAPSDSRNLWPEAGGIPNPKDRLENTLRAKVCSGQLGLGRAQRMVATNWVDAYRQTFGANP